MKEMLKKIWFGRSIRHSVLYALGLGLLFSIPRALFFGWSALFMALPAGIFFVYPILLTLINLIYSTFPANICKQCLYKLGL